MGKVRVFRVVASSNVDSSKRFNDCTGLQRYKQQSAVNTEGKEENICSYTLLLYPPPPLRLQVVMMATRSLTVWSVTTRKQTRGQRSPKWRQGAVVWAWPSPWSPARSSWTSVSRSTSASPPLPSFTPSSFLSHTLPPSPTPLKSLFFPFLLLLPPSFLSHTVPLSHFSFLPFFLNLFFPFSSSYPQVAHFHRSNHTVCHSVMSTALLTG